MDNTLLKAISFATLKHNSQTRKDKKTPYISHSLGVALLVSQETSDNDVIIAAILHDTIEDTDTNFEEIKMQFGDRVAGFVWECTEEDRSFSSQERKDAVLLKIEKMSHEAALIKSADILHNMYEIVEKIQSDGIAFLKQFNASPERKLLYEKKRLELLKKYHPNALVEGVEAILIRYERLINQGIKD